MKRRIACAPVLLAALAGCSGERWPDPPPVEQAQYEKDHHNGQELQLTAIGEPDEPEFFVMFKDPTNQSTTYSGYRIVAPTVVKAGEWTVLDFNFAMNPPCAYSPYTVCPLPPPENRLPVAVEAGLMRLPSAQGYSNPALTN